MKLIAVRKSILKSILSLFAATLLLASCGNNSGKALTDSGIVSAPRLMSKNANFSTVEVAEVAEDDTELKMDYNSPDSYPQDKKLIKTGNVDIEVQSLSQTILAVEQMVGQFGGYISNTNETQSNVYLTVQIPSENFDSVINLVGDFGKIRRKNIYTSDVTDQYYDLETRLLTKRELLKKLQGYLKNASNMDEILKIETKISDVTSELEVMQGQMNRLSKQISFSTITINAKLPPNHTEEGFVFPDAKEGFRDFVSNLVEFVFNFFMAVLYIVVFGTPIVLFLIFLYWLCFGKLGLVKKLFKKAK